MGPRITVGSRLAQAALPLAIADDLKSGITTVENLMVPKRLSLNRTVSSPLAAFGLVSGMVFPVFMFPAALLFGLTELLIPELARCAAAGSEKRIQYLVHTTLRVALVYGALTGGLLCLLSDTLCVSLYGNIEAAKPMRAYALLVPMLYSDIVTDAMTKGLGQQKVCVRYNILTSLLDVLFLYILLPRYGMIGYFASFLVTHLINFILSLRRLLKITIRFIPAYIPILAAASILLSVWAAGHVTVIFLRCVAYILLLSSLFVMLGILRKDDIQWAKSLIYKK